MLIHINNHPPPPPKQKMAHARAKNHRETKPHIIRHHHQHQQIRNRRLQHVQRALHPMPHTHRPGPKQSNMHCQENKRERTVYQYEPRIRRAGLAADDYRR